MARERRQRQVAVAASFAAHAVLLGFLAYESVRPVGTVGTEGVQVSLFDGQGFSTPPLARPPSKAPAHIRPPPVAPAPAEVRPLPVALEPPADEQRLSLDPQQDPAALSMAASAQAAAGQPCQLGLWLQAALQSDPSVAAALAAVPRSDRSVANAMMLWDTRWSAQPMGAVQGVSVIRAAMTAALRAAPERCQGESVRGPELMTLSDPSGTIVLAIGSGEWRWGDLLSEGLTDDQVGVTPTVVASK